MDCALFNFRSS